MGVGGALWQIYNSAGKGAGFIEKETDMVLLRCHWLERIRLYEESCADGFALKSLSFTPPCPLGLRC